MPSEFFDVALGTLGNVKQFILHGTSAIGHTSLFFNKTLLSFLGTEHSLEINRFHDLLDLVLLVQDALRKSL